MVTTSERIPASFRFKSGCTCKYNGNTITHDLQLKINKAREEYKEGNFVRCQNKQELQNFLDAL